MIYKLGPKSISADFFAKFSLLLEQFAICSGSIIISGDINIRVDQPEESASTTFNQLLADCGCTQWVTSSTHDGGGICDVLLSRTDDKPLAIDMIDVSL